MFDFLKKKISSFTQKLRRTIEEKREEAKEDAPKGEAQKQAAQKAEGTSTQKPQAITEAPAQKEEQESAKTIPPQQEETAPRQAAEKEPRKTATQETREKKPQGKKLFSRKKELPPQEKRELKAKVGIAKKISGLITGQVTLSKKDFEGFLEELELSLLEADIEAKTAQEIVAQLEKDFDGKKIPSSADITEFLRAEIKKALLFVMKTQKIDFLEMASKKKPFIVLFLGTNGAGKTTTIAKIASVLKENGKSAVLCASDTFRAASIEQLEVHAKALGIKVIKQGYGSDPAAVAFDAIAYAKSKHIDVVLIDSAGRQETNKNLVEELKKLSRVAKPDLRIFVGEAYAGQALLSQAREFGQAAGIDCFILTKIDVDAKGGSAISLLFNLKKPVIFVGTGQEYSDLKAFEPEFVVERVV